MSLYLKYRPQKLDQVVGNADVVEYLENCFRDEVFSIGDVPHVFLLQGPTGCGKTTIARIIASLLGCEGVDFKELNVADLRGIDTIRDIIRQAQYYPMQAENKSRVWLLDEAQKLTSDAQHGLLKILEDTPKQVYFIICTTEPNKLLKTIRGRCVTLAMKPLTEQEMHGLLRTVTKEEGKKVHRDIYGLIYEKCEGRPRDSLQLLELVINADQEKQAKIIEDFGREERESIELCRALIAGDGWKKVSNILQGLKDQDAESIRRHVLGYAQSVLLNKPSDQAALVIQEFWSPLYDMGFAGLVFCCYSVIKG